MNAVLEKIYEYSPIFFQNLMTTAYGYHLFRTRYCGKHDKYLQELMESQWLSASQIEELQIKKLQETVRHAYENVPFYRKVFNQRGLKPQDIRSMEDLTKLPIVEKESVRKNPELFLARNINKRDILTIYTSGTTGKTLKIFVDKNSRRLGYAFFSRFKLWLGVRDAKNATFAGRTIIPSRQTRPIFWRYNHKMNNYLFSSYHLSHQNLPFYVKKLQEIQPKFIDSYPSSIYIIAKHMKCNGITGVPPKAIITSAETLFDYQRETIEEVFQCPVFDQYGCAEQVVFVSQCEKSSYHIHPEFGIVEFIRQDGSGAEPGEPARLICTGLTNRAMPLIRYDIGDTGILSDKQCTCGRNFPVIDHIVGRTDDILITSDGRQVGRLDPVFKGLQSIREAQIVQEDYDHVSLRIVPGKNFQKHEAEIIVRELKKRLGTQTNIDVEVIAEIPRSAGGKFRAIISKIGKM